jgi:NitT/TauT family transport system substrate-binding protein
MRLRSFLTTALIALLIRSQGYTEEKTTIRVGHFPTITHAQGVIGHHLSREGRGWFEKKMGDDVEIQWFVYEAGPPAMEALVIDSLDISYVGPSPTINAYMKFKGKLNVFCGSCSGGAALVVHDDGSIKNDADFQGKKIGTPEFGNTQDVAARAWLRSKGYHFSLTEGDVTVIPTVNSEQLQLFKSGGLDAVWTIEPWVSELLLNGNGKIYLEESSLWKETLGRYVTAHLVCRNRFLKQHPELIKKWIQAQIELTAWIKDHPSQAKKLFRKEIKEETNVWLSEELLNKAWGNIELTHNPIQASLMKYAEEAFAIGFLKEKPDLKNLYQLDLLMEVIKQDQKDSDGTTGTGTAD